MDPTLIQLLCCPVTRQPLRLATEEERKKVPTIGNEALIREDGKILYPIRDGIPLLVASEAISIH